jgi:hypothetical protein
MQKRLPGTSWSFLVRAYAAHIAGINRVLASGTLPVNSDGSGERHAGWSYQDFLHLCLFRSRCMFQLPLSGALNGSGFTCLKRTEK